MPTIKTVVNKLNGIDNTYRNFSLEILAGEKDTNVTVKENACLFKFDFANVYWNPRLGFEHERVVKLLNENVNGRMDHLGAWDGDEADENGATNKKPKAKRKRLKKSSQIAENKDSISNKMRDDFKDVSFSKRKESKKN